MKCLSGSAATCALARKWNSPWRGLRPVFTAEVYALSNEVNVGTRTLSVRARCNNPNNLLAGQLCQEVSNHQPGSAGGLAPTDAVIPVLNGPAGVADPRRKVLPQR
ncbi:MAG: hypothetical protein IPI11_07995 [Haliscomenobacter sp.]|nr:hypothetical protein [Haliscomenobacter sp.]